jgi:hypothetical protein
MDEWLDGIEHPTQQEFEEHDRIIRKYTLLVPDSDFDSGNSYYILKLVLRSANTVRNYHRQPQAGRGSKRRRDDVDTPNGSDSKCMPWQSVFRTD